MNALIERNVIRELSCNGNFAYILSRKEDFLPVEYKVLVSKSGDGFVKCVRMLFDGQIQLYYNTENLRPLQNVVSSMNSDSFLLMVSNLLSTVVDARSNGFLSCQNIEVAFEKIFVDPSTLKVSLVYLPLAEHLHSDYDAFENELRTGLVRLINSLSQLSSARVTRLSLALSNGMMALEDVIEDITKGKQDDLTVWEQSKKKKDPEQKKTATLVALSGRKDQEIPLTKEETVIGKNPYMVDAVVDYNPAVSRVHCKISAAGGSWRVTDMGSANGTYINGIRLLPRESGDITNGDIIRLATSEFRFVVK